MQPVDERGKLVEKLLGGRYEVFGFLGRGGFASVYQVRSESLQRFEALKVLHESHGAESDFARRFRQEARVAASLEHPNIVKVYDFGHVEGMLWYSMQFVEGLTLSGELAKRRVFDEEAAARIAVPLLDALDYSHALGVIHRDIKPDNVLLDKRVRPFLMDFGIAKIGESLVKTQTGFILGSPAYLSPEQLRGLPLDGRTDVYSLGVTLYEMLAGVVPYRTENMSALARRLTEEAPRLSGRREGVNPELERIVHRSLERDREARYANAAEMRDDLEAFLADVYPRTTRGRSSESLTPQGRAGTEQRAAGSGTPGPFPAASPPSAALPSPPLPAPASASIPAAAPASAPVPASAGRPAWLWPAVGIFALLVAVACVWLATRPSGPAAVPAPAPTPVPTPAPQRVPTSVPTAIPTAIPTPVPVAPTAVPTVAPTAAPTPPPVERPTAARAPTRAPAASRTAPAAEAGRRAKTPPDVATEATISLTPAQERECGGKVVGVSLVIGEDGLLRSRRVISSASSTCDAVALEAVARNSYKPALDERGKPVEGRFLLSIRF